MYQSSVHTTNDGVLLPENSGNSSMHVNTCECSKKNNKNDSCDDPSDCCESSTLKRKHSSTSKCSRGIQLTDQLSYRHLHPRSSYGINFARAFDNCDCKSSSRHIEIPNIQDRYIDVTPHSTPTTQCYQQMLMQQPYLQQPIMQQQHAMQQYEMQQQSEIHHSSASQMCPPEPCQPQPCPPQACPPQPCQPQPQQCEQSQQATIRYFEIPQPPPPSLQCYEIQEPAPPPIIKCFQPQQDNSSLQQCYEQQQSCPQSNLDCDNQIPIPQHSMNYHVKTPCTSPLMRNFDKPVHSITSKQSACVEMCQVTKGGKKKCECKKIKNKLEKECYKRKRELIVTKSRAHSINFADMYNTYGYHHDSHYDDCGSRNC